MEQKPQRIVRSPLFRLITASGTVLLLLAFVILRYEGFFAAVRSVLHALRPLLIGVLFASMLNPSYERLRTDFAAFASRHRHSPDAGWIRAAAAAGAALPPVLILVSLCCVLIPQLSSSVQLFSDNFSTYSDNLLQWLRGFQRHPLLRGLAPEQPEALMQAIRTRIPDMLRSTYRGTANALHWLLDLGIGAVFSLYLLTDKRRLGKQLRQICGCVMKPEACRRAGRRARHTCETFARFLSSQLKESLILGVLCWLGMLLFRFPYPVLGAVLIGTTNIVPYLGPLIGTVPCALLILAVKPGAVLWFILFIVVLQQIESNLIYPRVVGGSIGLPPAWVLGAITLCGGLFGAVGLLLGVPLAAVIYAALFHGTDSPAD